MTDLNSINVEDRLYVRNCGGGYSCYGFEVLFQKSLKLQAWLAARGVEFHPPNPDQVGTEQAYHHYERMMDAARSYCESHKVRCDIELTPQLAGLEGRRVEVETNYGETRRFWVGKSGGWMPCHLEIARRTSHGGGAAMGPYKSVWVVR